MPAAEVLTIIVKRDQLPGGIGELQNGIQWGIETARINFRNDGVVRPGRELEHIPVSLRFDASVDHDRQGYFLRFGHGIIRFLVDDLGQRIQCKRQRVGDVTVLESGEPANPGLRVRGRWGYFGGSQVPALDLDHRAGPHLAAQRKKIRHKRDLANSNAVNKILTTAIDGVVDRECIFAILGDMVEDRRVRFKPEVVAVGHLFSLGIVKRQHRLKPARNRIRNERNQLPRLCGNHQVLTLAGGEAIPVAFLPRQFAH